MQLEIITTKNGTFSLEIEPKQTIADVKQFIHDEYSIEVADQVLSCDGKYLNSTLKIEDIQMTSPLKLVLNVVDNEVGSHQVGYAIALNDIPVAEKAATESDITAKFSGFGKIEKLVVKTDSPSFQHAVVIFTSKEAANSALSFSETINGGKIKVALAKQLSNEDIIVDSKEKDLLSKFLEDGSCQAKKCAESLKEFDDRHQISSKLKQGVDLAASHAKTIDEQLKLSEKMKLAGEKITEFDTNYGISKKASAAYTTAQEKGKDVLKNETVAAGVNKVDSIFNSVKAFSTKNIDDFKQKMKASNA